MKTEKSKKTASIKKRKVVAEESAKDLLLTDLVSGPIEAPLNKELHIAEVENNSIDEKIEDKKTLD